MVGLSSPILYHRQSKTPNDEGKQKRIGATGGYERHEIKEVQDRTQVWRSQEKTRLREVPLCGADTLCYSGLLNRHRAQMQTIGVAVDGSAFQRPDSSFGLSPGRGVRLVCKGHAKSDLLSTNRLHLALRQLLNEPFRGLHQSIRSPFHLSQGSVSPDTPFSNTPCA